MTPTAHDGPDPHAPGDGPVPVRGDLAAWHRAATHLVRDATADTGHLTGARTFTEAGFDHARYGWVLATAHRRFVVVQLVALWDQADTLYPPRDAYTEPDPSGPYTARWFESWLARTLSPLGRYTQTLTGADLTCDIHTVGVRVHVDARARVLALIPWILAADEPPTARNRYTHSGDTEL